MLVVFLDLCPVPIGRYLFDCICDVKLEILNAHVRCAVQVDGIVDLEEHVDASTW